MKALIITLALLISSSAYAQETVKIVGLKSTDAEAVASTLKNVIEAVDKDKDDKKRPSTEQMAESMFKRIDVDKNGSLSLKEFKAFYAKIRSRGRSSSGPQRSSSRDGLSRPRGGPQRGGERDRKKDK